MPDTTRARTTTSGPRGRQSLVLDLPALGVAWVRLQVLPTESYAVADAAPRRAGSRTRLAHRQRQGERGQTHRVIIGPFTTVQQAEAMLDQVLAAGVTDARIVVE